MRTGYKGHVWKEFFVYNVLMVALVGLICSGCGASGGDTNECNSLLDCEPGQQCIRHNCEDPDIVEGDFQTETDSSNPNCESAVQTGEIVLNEILSAVPGDDIGDVNQDGVRDANQDEFLELVNISGGELCVKGLRILKGESEKHVVSVRALEANQALIIFGGLQEDANIPQMAGSIVEISDHSLGLPNSGGSLSVLNQDDTEIISLTYPSASNSSLNLDPELRGTEYVVSSQHFGVSFSPGTCADGRSFDTGCLVCDDNDQDGYGIGPDCLGLDCNDNDENCFEGDCCPPPICREAQANDLVINEILSAVPTEDIGDANGDGSRDASEDEFVEIVNVSNENICVLGLTLAKDVDIRHTIATEYLEPSRALVVFGGLLSEATLPEYPETTVEIADRSFGLPNSGGRLVLGENLIEVNFQSASGTSLALSPQLTGGEYTAHPMLNDRPYSPGSCTNGNLFSSGCADVCVDSDQDGCGSGCGCDDCDDDDVLCQEGDCCTCVDIDEDGCGLGCGCDDCDDNDVLCQEGDCCLSCQDNDQDGCGTNCDCEDCDDDDVSCQSGPCCPVECRDPSMGDLVLNEILANVPTDETIGDANQDGERDAGDDEFLEIVNVNSECVKIAGVQIAKDDSVKHSIQFESLESYQAIVVFGGPSGATPPILGNSLVEFSTTNFAWRNSGDQGVNILAPNGDSLISFTLPATEPGSLTLDEQLTGSDYISHPLLDDRPYSPGFCVDGREFETRCE